MLLSSHSKDILQTTIFESFTEGFNYYEEATNEYLVGFIEDLTRLNEANLAVLSSIIEGANPNLKNNLITFKNTSKNVFLNMAKWSAKFISWVKSFVLQSSTWVRKNEKRIKQNAHKIDSKEIKYNQADLEGAEHIIESSKAGLTSLESLYTRVANVSALENLKLPEAISVKQITDYNNVKEALNHNITVTSVTPDIDQMISNVYKIEGMLKGVTGFKNNMNSLKTKVDKFVDSLDAELPTQTFKNAYNVNTFFRISISSIMQSLTAAIKILNTELKQTLKLFRSII